MSFQKSDGKITIFTRMANQAGTQKKKFPDFFCQLRQNIESSWLNHDTTLDVDLKVSTHFAGISRANYLGRGLILKPSLS